MTHPRLLQTYPSDDAIPPTKYDIFCTVSMTAGFITGGYIKEQTAWKNSAGQTMDEVVRRGE